MNKPSFVGPIAVIITASVSNIYLAIVLFKYTFDIFSENRDLSVAIMLFAGLTSFFAIYPFFIIEIKKPIILISLIVQGICLIFIFAAIYKGYGLEYDCKIGNELCKYHDTKSALYFSIVTWTTLGYGDIQPPIDLRLVAAIQALLGYLFLGLIVAVMGGMLSQNKFNDK